MKIYLIYKTQEFQMKIFAISDLHLSGHTPKPMDVFGSQWEGHWRRIREAWNLSVTREDAVLLPGDITWAMTMEQAQVDIGEIAELPGTKVLLRGNHDYWWGSVNRVRSALPAGMLAVQNDCVRLGKTVICGTRGWTCPGSSSWEGAEDEKIYLRELIRLRLTLDAAKHKLTSDDTLIAMLHFPPFNERLEQSGFTALLEDYGVKIALYGHLHGIPAGSAFEGWRNGVMYHMVSCDYLGFKPKLILE
jgi:predicted phosphohydrolase